jgi:hypothetical protein
MTHASPDEADRWEQQARQKVAEGSAGDSVRLALDQLAADRTNGEPLDTALRRLRDSLSGGDRTERDNER